MSLYYTISGTYKHGRVADRAAEVFCIFWDHKKKVHTFVSLRGVTEYPHQPYGTPVVFESEEHETEFLKYHPDAACLRRYFQGGYWYACTPWAVEEEKLPFEYRRARWCWKKPLTVA